MEQKRVTLFLLGVLTICLIVAYVLNNISKNIERFHSEPPRYINVKTTDYEIKPYQEHTQEVRQQVIAALQKEWSGTGITYTDEFIMNTWKYPDVLYVMSTANVNANAKFIGCAGLDRKYMLPFVSHMYVIEEYRKKGYGETLFSTVMTHGKNMGYTTLNGWCTDDLVPHYEKMGCEKQNGNTLIKPMTGGFNLMKRDLV